MVWFLYLINCFCFIICFFRDILLLFQLRQISLSSHFAQFSLYEIRWNSYCAIIGVSLNMWGCGSIPYMVCMCPVPLVRKLDLTWTQVMSSLRIGLQPSPWWEAGLGVGRQRLSWVWSRDFPHLSVGHCPVLCGVSQIFLVGKEKDLLPSPKSLPQVGERGRGSQKPRECSRQSCGGDPVAHGEG